MSAYPLPAPSALLAWVARRESRHLLARRSSPPTTAAVDRWRPVIVELRDAPELALPRHVREWLDTPIGPTSGARPGSGARDRRRLDLARSLEAVAQLAAQLEQATSLRCLELLGEALPEPLTAEQVTDIDRTVSALAPRRKHAPLVYIRDRWRPWLLALACASEDDLGADLAPELCLSDRLQRGVLRDALRLLIAG